VFCIKKQIGNIKVPIHTGGVDAMWLSKLAIPCESCDQSQPSEPKADAKHQGLVMALEEPQSRKPFGDHWSLVGEAHGHVKGGTPRASLANQTSCKLQELIKNSMKIPRNF
jgi:hypothetical protein